MEAKTKPVRFHLSAYKPDEALDYDQLATPTMGLEQGILNPELCMKIYGSGKFNNFMPANFWRVKELSPTEKHEYFLEPNTKEVWCMVDESDWYEDIPLIPAYTSGELWEMLPEKLTFGDDGSNVYEKTQVHEILTKEECTYYRGIKPGQGDYSSHTSAHGKTEVTSRAKLLVKLIEQSLV